MMFRNRRYDQLATVWTTVAMLFCQPFAIHAEEIAGPQQKHHILDVALQSGGALHGQVLDQQGRPLAASEILVHDGKRQWRTTTDVEGQFVVAGLRGASYQVCQGNQVKLVRCWATGTAPPNATPAMLLVEPREVVRAQKGGDPRFNRPLEHARDCLANPFVFGGIVATAVAIPVAIHNANQDDDPPATP